MSNPKIAIIGGGIGGTTCAYFVKKLFGNNASVSLFERDIIGGRLATINVVGEYYESGGSVIHQRNKYMQDFTTLLGLKPRAPFRTLWGIYNGEKFLFQDSEWSVITLLNLYWRYGWDIFRLNSIISSLLDDFSRIYRAQDDGLSFTSVHTLLSYMSPKFPNMTQIPLESFLKNNGFSENFIKELVQSVTLVNYGQTVSSMNAFAGSVALAGSGSALWSIHGGNNQVPISLIHRVDARVFSGQVSDIKLLKTGAFMLTYRHNPPKDPIYEEYDFVVIASPLIAKKRAIKFHDFPKELSKYEHAYHRTVATFVYGTLRPSAFQANTIPDVILTNNDSLPFSSIGLSFPISGSERKTNSKVYKLFSKVPLTEEQVKFLFDDIRSVKFKDWMAYPQYAPPENIPSFVLHPGLYYLSPIELAASAMEMSVVSARNIALLIHNYWNNKLVSIDPVKRIFREDL